MSFFELFDIVAGARRNTAENIENPVNSNNNNRRQQQDEDDNQLNDAESQAGNTILTSENQNLETSSDKNGSDLVANELKVNNENRTASNSKFQLKLNRNNSNNSNGGGASSNPNSPRNLSPRNHSPRNHNNQRSGSILESTTNKLFIDGLLGPSLVTKSDEENNNGTTPGGDEESNNNGTTNGGENNNNNNNGKTPGGEFDYYDEYYTEKGELKLFVKPKKWWQFDTFITSISYLSMLSLIALFLSVIVCAYISFYVVLGNRFVFLEKEDKPTWGIVTWVITGVINEQLLVTIAFCVLTSQFGFKATKCSLPAAIIFSLASAIFTALARIYGITGTGDFIPKYFLTLGNIIVVSLIVGIKTFKSKMFCFWISLPYVTMGIILIAYDYFLIKWYIKESTGEFAKSIVRIIIHPVVTAFLLLISRFCINQLSHLKPRSLISLMLIPIAFNSFYGRLFGNTMDTLQGVVISSLILSLLEIVWKCSLRARDSFIVRFLCRCSGNAAAIMQQNLPLYTEYQSFEMIYDVTSSFVSTFLVAVYFFTFTTGDGQMEGIQKQFKIMAIQLAFCILTEVIVAYFSLAYLKLPIVIPYKKRKEGFLFITCFSFLCVIAFISIRIINILHNQWIL